MGGGEIIRDEYESQQCSAWWWWWCLLLCRRLCNVMWCDEMCHDGYGALEDWTSRNWLMGIVNWNGSDYFMHCVLKATKTLHFIFRGIKMPRRKFWPQKRPPITNPHDSNSGSQRKNAITFEKKKEFHFINQVNGKVMEITRRENHTIKLISLKIIMIIKN